MVLLNLIAEQRIEEAMRAGAFDDLPGAGKPLDLDDDRLVPEELRAAYRMLRNAGFVPPELEARREMAELHHLLATIDDQGTRDRAHARLAALQAMLEANGRRFLPAEGAYRARLLARFSRCG